MTLFLANVAFLLCPTDHQCSAFAYGQEQGQRVTPANQIQNVTTVTSTSFHGETATITKVTKHTPYLYPQSGHLTQTDRKQIISSRREHPHTRVTLPASDPKYKGTHTHTPAMTTPPV